MEHMEHTNSNSSVLRPFGAPAGFPWNLNGVVALLLATGTLAAQEPQQPSAPPVAVVAAAQPAAEEPESATNAAPATVATNPAPATARVERQAMVVFGHDVELKADETVESVVVFGGTARVHGKVRDAVVAIGGNIEVDGEVGDAVVAVLGGIKAKEGAHVKGEMVSVGGRVELAPGAKVDGQVQEVDFGLGKLAAPAWLKGWIVHCVFKMRPLALQVGWVWAVAGVFFLLYLLIAVVLPRPIEVCVTQLRDRPATTFLLGLLTKMLAPVVMFVLMATGLGIVVIPFLMAALFIGAIVGKVALIEWLGFQLGQRFSPGIWQKPLAAFLIGAVLVTVLYLVWVVGLIVYGVLSIWGLGVAAVAAFGGLRREMPEKPAPPPGPGPLPVGTPLGSGAAASSIDPTAGTAEGAAVNAGPGVAAIAAAVVPETLAYPKAGFWHRMGAAFLDLVLVGIVSAPAGAPWPFVVMLAYFSAMWAWKGTTIGGIVLGLKVVRLDHQPISFPVAIVRALAAAFSTVVFFLGFLWIAWDEDKQGWHDKIAGTVVLRLPRGTPLLAL